MDGRSGRLFGFGISANFSHNFSKPYDVTLDLTDMKLYIVRGKPS